MFLRRSTIQTEVVDLTQPDTLKTVVAAALQSFEKGHEADLKLRFALMAVQFQQLSPDEMKDEAFEDDLFELKGNDFFKKAFAALMKNPSNQTLINRYSDAEIFKEMLKEIESFSEYEEGFDAETLKDLKKYIVHYIAKQAEHYLKTFPPILNCQAGEELYTKTRRFIQFKDPHFSYDMNHIDENVYVGAGPQTHDEIVNLLKNTVFNAKKPISNIVALGDKINCGDFLNYFAYPQGTTVSYNTQRGIFKYMVKTIEGEWEGLLKPLPDKTLTPAEVKGESRFIKSVLAVTDEKGKTAEVTVHFFKVRDNHPLYLTGEAALAMDELGQLTSNILFHCASGIGRSGEAAFRTLLKRKLPDLLGGTAAITGENISQYLVSLRKKSRPALINAREQLKNAIKEGITPHIDQQLMVKSTPLLDRSSLFYYDFANAPKTSSPPALAATIKLASPS